MHSCFVCFLKLELVSTYENFISMALCLFYQISVESATSARKLFGDDEFVHLFLVSFYIFDRFLICLQ